MDYYFGISWKGIILFLLPMIPNLFYFLIPKKEKSTKDVKRHLFLDILEHGSQGVFVFLLIFIMKNQTSETISPYSIGMGIMLILYYVLWVFYFTARVNLSVLLGLAIVPVIYFILAEIWLYNYLAIIPTVFFGIVHVIITYKDFQMYH